MDEFKPNIDLVTMVGRLVIELEAMKQVVEELQRRLKEARKANDPGAPDGA